MEGSLPVQSQFTVGISVEGKGDRLVVRAEDALIAALKVKAERPEATITYVRRLNRRGDAPSAASARRNPQLAGPPNIAPCKSHSLGLCNNIEIWPDDMAVSPSLIARRTFRPSQTSTNQASDPAIARS